MQRFSACVVIGICLGVCLAIPAGISEEQITVPSARQADGSIGNLLVSFIRPIIQGVTSFLTNVLRPDNRTQSQFEGFVVPGQGQETPFVLLTQNDDNANLLKSSLGEKVPIEEPGTQDRVL
ncbi:uncharacterized protein LOC106665212 [Cimex lectularius]|uniref:Uncharacterized protein n=1 Tax=Cimex lectularius TaxID=79782 RepID=A0A8I6RP26_CIMLE|nr:uncharacterized protein LOC106665212 [Cimex lectularius]